MAYNKENIFEQAKEAVKKQRPIFIEELISFLPVSKSTFYEMFPNESEELDVIKELINDSKIELKASMRNKWYKSQNATLQMGLMKLIGTDEERKRLNQTYTDITTKGKEINREVSDEDIDARIKELAQRASESNQ